MIDELQLFKGQNYVINNHISIKHPTLDQICEYGEQEYYNMILTLCATPSDYKVQLLDLFHRDYETVNEFEFFAYLCSSFNQEQTSILFDNLDFKKFKLDRSSFNGELILIDEKSNTIIDSVIYFLIVNYLRKIHSVEKNISVGGNKHTKDYLIEKERRKLTRRKDKNFESILFPQVSALVNCEQFKYDHKTVWNLPIYVFLDSVKRIQKIKNYNQTMHGVYFGTVDLKSISLEKINWMGSLSEN